MGARALLGSLQSLCERDEKEIRVNIYVGNLSYETTDDDLRQAFGAFGKVASATVIMDRDTGKSRGFGFVEMPEQAEAQAAIAGLNGKELQSRTLTVNEARPPQQRGGGGGGGGRRDSW